ncbi:MAG: Glu/Leu/Phe/Val dehydrogenase family protein [Acidobacteriota bacterium]
MHDDILPLLEAWDGEGVVVRYDQPTGTWIFVALHSSRLGRPTGGTRVRVYSGLRDAMRDAMRLAEGMTYKWAGLGLGYGGGKTVMALSRPLDADEKRGLMHRYGELLEGLGGAFATGADLGTDSRDIAHMAERTQYVVGVDREAGGATDPGPFTARGVLAGIRSAVAHHRGDPDATGLADVRVLIQGLGGVGGPLARLLDADGAELLLTDRDTARAEALAGALDRASVVATGRTLSEPCDVYAPCAIGGVLHQETIPELRCHIVAGSANNQLAEEDDAERLARRGILYVPDYIINAGGALAFSMIADGLDDLDEIHRRVDAIGVAVAEILAEASSSGATPLAAARTRVDRMFSELAAAAS